MQLRIFTIFLFAFFVNVHAQTKKEDIYFLFRNNMKDSCQYSPNRDGSDKRITSFVQTFKYGCFVYLNQYFEIVPNSRIQSFSEQEIKKLNVVNLDYFLRKREQNRETQLSNPNNLFGKIYVLTANSDGHYFQFEVQWKEMFID